MMQKENYFHLLILSIESVITKSSSKKTEKKYPKGILG